MNTAKAALKYQVCAALNYEDGTKEHSVAQLAMDVALQQYPIRLSESGWEVLESPKKARKREERTLRERVKWRVLDEVRDDPPKYGFVGILGMIFLAIQVYGIVKQVVEWLMDQRYSGSDDRIVAAARGGEE